MLANPVSVVMLLSGGFYMSIQSLPPVRKARNRLEPCVMCEC